MKTAISVPDTVYQRAERRARALGLNRSEFYTRAAVHFLDGLDQEDVTERLDAAIAAAGAESGAEQLAWASSAAARLPGEDDW